MDSEAINPAKGSDIRAAKPRESSGKSGPPAPQVEVKSAPDDTVSLSPAAKEALESSAPEARSAPGAKNATTDINVDKSRKLQVTESNDVVLKIVDNKTREVVKQIPSEEEVQLKNAIRDGIEDISPESKPTEDLI
ncbi:MAG: hypothetical protein NPINA01_19350 [Nitrospinaceae bacterium]|nr:MAG: hypothetical protein NPINA01_19350 [Nitrospinaceae bacterium]